MNIVDSIMGTGKTSWAIRYINQETEKRFIYVTPYKTEIERIILACPGRHFVQPEELPTKGAHFIELLKTGENIATTHQLFKDIQLTPKIESLLREFGYILILDEVLDVVENENVSAKDMKMLLGEGLISADEETGLVSWTDDGYKGRFEPLMRRIKHGNIYYFENMLLWQFPVNLLAAFEEIYVLTFMFEGSPMEQYLSIYKFPVLYFHIQKEGFLLKEGLQDLDADKLRIAGLIDLCTDERMNELGLQKPGLRRDDANEHVSSPYSKTWWEKARKKQIKNPSGKKTTLAMRAVRHAYNYLYNYCGGTAQTVMWSTYIDETAQRQKKKHLLERDFGSGFCPCNSRATNQYRERHHLAYLINVYCNPVIQQWFRSHGGRIDEDRYALSQLLQWLWRSQLRDGGSVSLYLPSERMQKLLLGWLRNSDP